MKKMMTFAVLAFLALASISAFALSEALHQPSILFPKGYDTNRSEQVLSVLRSNKFHFLGGLVSYWSPEWSTTLVYEGDGKSLTEFLQTLARVKGIHVAITYSTDLSKETGSALQAGSWWVKYSHTAPDVITVRINRAAEGLGSGEFESKLPRPKPDLP